MRSILLLLVLAAVSAEPGAAAPAAPTPLEQAEALLLAQRTQPDAGNFERAKQLVIAATNTTPDAAQAWRDLAWVRLIEHRFAEALKAAVRADSLAPGDGKTLALLSDAQIELGQYDAAEKTLNRLLDVAPNVPAWVRAAHLRFLYADLPGARVLLRMAARAGAPGTEQTAWVWLDLARLALHAHDLAEAGVALAAAEQSAPKLPALFAAKARWQEARGNPRAALKLYQQALNAQPTAEDALAAWRIARALAETGTTTHLAALLAGIAKLDAGGLSRRALAEYFAESGRPEEALRLARAEAAARPDIYSAATLARVQHALGNWVQAKIQAETALALGTLDPQLQADMHAILAQNTADAPQEARR